MNRKGRTLSADDLRAVDLLLDLGAANAHAVTRLAAPACQRRVAAATRLLSMLDRLPAGDPPAGLAARTMAKVDAARPTVARPTSVTPLHLH